MDPQAYFFVLLVCFTMLLCNDIEGGHWNISADEDLDFEREFKVLNKPSIKTIFTITGDIFDCVDFYKQPAFDHALLYNYTIEYEHNPISLQRKLKDPSDIGKTSEECPIGSVPIKRITKEDIIRERFASKFRNFTENMTHMPGTHYAVVRTKPGINKFVGAGSIGSVWTPQVSGKQYSAGRMKIANGIDSIEIGWRADPALYGDSNTRFYIRTDTGRSHCFDTRCGFVVIDTSIVIGALISRISKRGGPIFEMELFIVEDSNTGNWLLEHGHDRKQIGFWPKGLFTGLVNLGASAEWGGEVFSPSGIPEPAMGAGFIPSGGGVYFDAYIRQMSLFDGQKTFNVDKMDTITDSINYQVEDLGLLKDTFFCHAMFYGGFAKNVESGLN